METVIIILSLTTLLGGAGTVYQQVRGKKEREELEKKVEEASNIPE